jgi:hypothetical protein
MLLKVLEEAVYMDREIFKYYIPCRTFMNFMCILFSEVFEINLENNEADKFLLLLKNENKFALIQQKLKLFYERLQAILVVIKRPKRYNYLINFVRCISFRSPKYPKVILCVKDSNFQTSYHHLISFFSFIDNIFQRNRFKSIRISSEKSSFQKQVIVIACLPEIISQIHLGSKRKYLTGSDWVGLY